MDRAAIGTLAPNTTVPPSALATAGTGPGLPLTLSREELETHILDSLRKRIIGRRVSLREIRRVAVDVGPIVADAVRQASVQGPLATLAQDEEITVEEAQKRWTAWQEADLLLESGGDPDAVSPAYAEGVAQWLAGTGRGAGLPINLKESRRLTAKIADLQWRIAWAAYLQTPEAKTANIAPPANSPATGPAELPALRTELDLLKAKRRRADARYNPRAAIFAQTRYLLQRYKRFPSPDWLFQAYHGGEGGAKRTLKLFLGAAWPGDTARAIAEGNSGHRLRFEDVYFAATPQSHPQAFGYLFGRSDDHRHYWWKLRVSAEALALYRKDPAGFEHVWEGYSPGRTQDAVWYPQAASLGLPELAALQAAHSRQALVAVASGADLVVRPAPEDLAHAALYAALRPEAKGALLLLTQTYRQAGGVEALPLGDLTLTQAAVAQAKILHPPPPPKGRVWPPDPDAKTVIGPGPPPDFDYHTTGLVFDILRPTDSATRKTLEYALDYWQNRQVIAVTDAKDRGERRYHITPNPRFAAELTRIAAVGRAPAFSL